MRGSEDIEYSIRKAVEDGVLLDITPLAHEANLRYPTFISTTFWNAAPIARSDSRLKALLEDAWIFRRICDERRFGSDLYALKPDLKKRGWPLAAFPDFADMGAHVLPSSYCGVIFVITHGEEQLDFRLERKASGSFYSM